MEDKTNTITKFSFNEDVTIINGFYKGLVGVIKDFKFDKDKRIYKVEVTDKDQQVKIYEVSEAFLKKRITSFFPFMR